MKSGLLAITIWGILFFIGTKTNAQWVQTNGPFGGVVNCIALSNTNIFAGTSSGGVYLSSDNGTSWKQIGPGHTGPEVRSLAESGSNIFAGTEDAGVWRRSLSDMITGIEDVQSKVPTNFSLSQNYPNPFNPTTLIKYQLPKSANVSLIIYDITGREVMKLVDQQQNAGYYIASFNASRLASGVYFYRIVAGDFVSVKKMMLLK